MRHVSRRDFLEATAAFSAATALSPFDAWARGIDGRQAEFDVAIVGAGSAGISAARTLAGTGRTFVVLEARDHIGGRCHCDNTSFPGIAFDLGGQWFVEVVPVIDGGGRGRRCRQSRPFSGSIRGRGDGVRCRRPVLRFLRRLPGHGARDLHRAPATYSRPLIIRYGRLSGFTAHRERERAQMPNREIRLEAG